MVDVPNPTERFAAEAEGHVPSCGVVLRAREGLRVGSRGVRTRLLQA